MALIAPPDLTAWADIDPAKAEEMIADAVALATLVAPCLSSLEVAPDGETEVASALRLGYLAAVKAVLRAAILRWNDAGTGGVQQESVGPFSRTIDTRSDARRNLFWPSEIASLQSLCSPSGASLQVGAVGSVRMRPGLGY